MANTQGVFDANQSTLQSLSSSALAGYNANAPAAYSTSPFVQNAQNNASAIGGGAFYGTNPGAQTYSNLMAAQNPSLGSLYNLTSSATANPASAGLTELAGSATANPATGSLNSLASNYANPAMSSLSTLANGSTSPGNYDGIGANNPALGAYAGLLGASGSNPAMGAYGRLLNGGTNTAIPGLAAYGYSSGSFGAGDGTLSQFASTGNNGMTNGADAYDTSVLSGKYLTNNPYIDAIANQATGAATKAANQRFGASGLGAGLSSAYTGALGSAVADANNTLRYNNYNTERGYQEAASGRVSNNYNLGQDRSESAANSLSAGSRADVATRIGALNDLSSANNARTQNALTAASGLGSLYNSGVQNALTAAGGLGSTFNNMQQLGLQGQQAKDSAFQNDRASQLAAASQLGDQYNTGVVAQGNLYGTAGNLYNQGQQNAQSAYGTLGSLYNQGQSNATAAASALGSQFNNTGALNLNAAQGADQSQQSQIQQMLSALGLTGSLTDAQYAGISPTLALAQAAAQLPYTGVNAYSGVVNSLTSPYGTKTTTDTPSTATQVGNGIKLAGQLGSLFSDRRLKTDIERVGEADDGLGIYDYNYAWGGPRQRGVMADEVARLRPWALGPIVAGFATVNYGAL